MDITTMVLLVILISLAWFGFLTILGCVALYFIMQRIVNNMGRNLNMVVGNVDRAIDGKMDRVGNGIRQLGELVKVLKNRS